MFLISNMHKTWCETLVLITSPHKHQQLFNEMQNFALLNTKTITLRGKLLITIRPATVMCRATYTHQT